MRKSLFSALLIPMLLLSGCNAVVKGRGPDKEEKKGKTEKEPAELLIPVSVEHPFRRDIAAYFETVSRIEAERRVEVLSKGNGECLSLLVEEGDTVEAGQILAELDREELESQVAQTRVSVAQNRFEHEKAQEQAGEGLLSPYEAELKRFVYEQAQATLQTQEIQLRNQTVVAPIGGIITLRNVQQGMVVSAGTPLFTVVDPASYTLPINVPQKELLRLREGQEAKVRIDARGSEEFTARIRRINPSVDAQTGTVKAILDFDEETLALLRDSAFARVKLVMDVHDDALVIPKDAILEENARKYLMLVTDEEAEEGESPTPQDDKEEAPAAKLVAVRQEVATGLEDSDYVEILSGVDESSRVVTLGQHTLKAGAQVRVTDTATELSTDHREGTEEVQAPA